MIDYPTDSETVTVIRRGDPSARVPRLVSRSDVEDLPHVRPEVDLCGWEVILADGSALGKVDRYLLDPQAQRLRYLAVAPPDRDGFVLIPIGAGSLDHARRRVRLKKPRADRLRSLPVVTSEVVPIEVECAVFAAMTGMRVSALALERVYRDPIFDSSRLLVHTRRDPVA